MNKLKILVTGANGQLGKELQVISSLTNEYEFIFFSREELPIHDNGKVRSAFESSQPDYCINCAAYTAVDKAESERDQAFLINCEAAGLLAEACNYFKIRFIHISTDYVFNGDAQVPYRETDTVDPVNTYGASKLEGEELVMNKNNESIIIRTSWVYSEFGNNFVKTMMRLMKERPNLGIVNDQQGSPTYAADLANFILYIISSGKWKAGIYNYSNEGIITWYQFAEAINEEIKSGCEINPITTKDFPTPAKRPKYSVLDKNKIKSDFDVIAPHWKDSLKICISRLRN